MTATVERPIKVWHYRGWCAICRPCKRAVAIDAGSQQNALTAALNHLRLGHMQTRLPVLPDICMIPDCGCTGLAHP